MNKEITQTDRVMVVCMELSHADQMVELLSINAEDAQKWIRINQQLQDDKNYSVWNVFDKQTRKYIGYCGCRDVIIENKPELELVWSLYKKYHEDDVDVETVFAIRNYMFKHFNITALTAIVAKNDPHDIYIAEAIDMEKDHTFFEGIHEYYVYVVKRDSEKFLISFGEDGSSATLTSGVQRDFNSPGYIRKMRVPRPRPNK